MSPGGKIIQLVILCLLLTLVVLKFRNVDYEKRGTLSPEEKYLKARKKTNNKYLQMKLSWDLALDYTGGRSEFSNLF